MWRKVNGLKRSWFSFPGTPLIVYQLFSLQLLSLNSVGRISHYEVNYGPCSLYPGHIYLCLVYLVVFKMMWPSSSTYLRWCGSPNQVFEMPFLSSTFKFLNTISPLGSVFLASPGCIEGGLLGQAYPALLWAVLCGHCLLLWSWSGHLPPVDWGAGRWSFTPRVSVENHSWWFLSSCWFFFF